MREHLDAAHRREYLFALSFDSPEADRLTCEDRLWLVAGAVFYFARFIL